MNELELIELIVYKIVTDRCILHLPFESEKEARHFLVGRRNPRSYSPDTNILSITDTGKRQYSFSRRHAENGVIIHNWWKPKEEWNKYPTYDVETKKLI